MSENQNLSPTTQDGMPRREFIRKSLTASGAAFVGMASGGKIPLPDSTANRMPRVSSSQRRGNNGVGNGEDPQPPGNPPINDGPGTGPGNPGNRGGQREG